MYFKLLRPLYCLNSSIDASLDDLTVSLLNIQVFCDVMLCHLYNLRDLYATPCGRIIYSSECRTR
jgi:hypothetical protein